MKTAFAVYTTVGRVRRENQDNFYLNGSIKPIEVQDSVLRGESAAPAQIFAVCDGMGGEESGEVAAFLAVEALNDWEKEGFEQTWKQYIQAANRKICHYQDKHRIQMGTTLAGLLLENDCMRAMNVGDSRIYRIREQEIQQLSKDHTEFQNLVEAGFYQPEDFSKTKTHNYLTQSLGVDEQDMELEPFSVRERLKDGDAFLLCSDGLYGVVTTEELQDIVLQIQNPVQCVQKLVEQAERNQSKDNITALLVRVEMEQDEEKFPSMEDTQRIEGIDEAIKLQEQTIERTLPLEIQQSISAETGVAKASGQKEQGNAHKGLVKKIILLTGILMLLAGGCFFYNWCFPKVPDMTGQFEAIARNQFEQAGFSVDSILVYSKTKKGIVLKQSAEQTRLLRGSQISIYVSKGIKTVQVPVLTGMQEQEAQKIIEKYRLEWEFRTTYDASKEEGYVISQTPEPGSSLEEGSIVIITVNKKSEEYMD